MGVQGRPALQAASLFAAANMQGRNSLRHVRLRERSLYARGFVMVRTLTLLLCAACHCEPGVVHSRQATHSMQSSCTFSSGRANRNLHLSHRLLQMRPFTEQAQQKRNTSKILAEHSQQHTCTIRILAHASLIICKANGSNSYLQQQTENRPITLSGACAALAEHSWQRKQSQQHTWHGQQAEFPT